MHDGINFQRIVELARKWQDKTISEVEKQEFDTWYNSAEENESIEVSTGFGDTEEGVKRDILANILGNIHGSGKADRGATMALLGFNWRRIVAAAALLAAFFSVGFYLIHTKRDHSAELSSAVSKPASLADIRAGMDGAILKLDDGHEILLDSSADGKVKVLKGIEAVKTKGQLVYRSGTAAVSAYNTMTTPRGRQYHIVLSDGTSVWLNASSSIRYPVVFDNISRTVEISGEVYFEVSKEVSRPFYVNIPGRGQIRVMGTHFNVNAYTDENLMKTTLLEGSVEVSSSSDKQKLLPGQQAILNGSVIQLNNAIDTFQVMGWKRGMFEFNNTSIPVLMRQISRWYDIDVRLEGNVSGRKLGGGISKYLPLEKVLKLLEAGNIQFRYENGVLVVKG
ncbi:MAG TPA: FecR domain-containing protein [Flavitalea sp.]|nr:FecR domain-containing protein [Flavitalea sp.]